MRSTVCRFGVVAAVVAVVAMVSLASCARGARLAISPAGSPEASGSFSTATASPRPAKPEGATAAVGPAATSASSMPTAVISAGTPVGEGYLATPAASPAPASVRLRGSDDSKVEANSPGSSQGLNPPERLPTLTPSASPALTPSPAVAPTATPRPRPSYTRYCESFLTTWRSKRPQRHDVLRWSPDGSEIFFSRHRPPGYDYSSGRPVKISPGATTIYAVAADGSYLRKVSRIDLPGETPPSNHILRCVPRRLESRVLDL